MKYNIVKKVSLKIYCDNTDIHSNKPLWEYILNKAKDLKLKGATVYKAVAGIGSTNTIHRFDLLSLSNSMPLVIEIIDDKEKIDLFLDSIYIDIKDTYITISNIEVLE